MDASHHQPWLGTGTENLMMVGFPVHGGQALHGQERASSDYLAGCQKCCLPSGSVSQYPVRQWMGARRLVMGAPGWTVG